ncbi:MAG: branched-chain amino acid transport system substrate-binding protein [Actinomycetota bacterium]|nr:branched-chain amino acid transport system substrate-binding protein [Actinomycetota bacterium]
MRRRALLRQVAGWSVVAVLAVGCGARIDPPAAQTVSQVGPGTAADTSQAAAGSTADTTADTAADTGAAPATGGAAAPAGGSAAAGSGTAAGAAAARPSTAAGSVTKSSGAGAQQSAGTKSGGAAAGAGGSAAGGSGGAAGGGTGPGAGVPPDAVKIGGASSQGVTDSEIRIGVLAPLSGAAGFLGELELDAVKAYLSDVNAKGGVRGRKYRIISADTRMESPTEATGARRLVEDDKVFGLIATFGDSLSPYAASRGIPTVTLGMLPPAHASRYPNVYPVGMNNVMSNAQMAYYLTKVANFPVKSAALIYETANVPWAPWAPYAKKAWEYFGIDVKSMDRFNISDGDCTQLVLKIRNLGVDFWQIAESLGWPLCQAAMARQNYTPKFGRGGPYTDDVNFVGQVGQASDGIYAMSNGVQIMKNKGQPWPFDPSGVAPSVDRFVNSMKQFSPKSADDIGLEGIWAQDFWTSAKLLDDAISRQVDAVTWKGVNGWIQSQKSWNGGLIAPANFDPKCKSGSAAWIFQFKWNGSRLVESDWQPYGGYKPFPDELKNFVMPGAGDCWLTAMADAELK